MKGGGGVPGTGMPVAPVGSLRLQMCSRIIRSRVAVSVSARVSAVQVGMGVGRIQGRNSRRLVVSTREGADLQVWTPRSMELRCVSVCV